MPLSLATRCSRNVTARSTVEMPSKLGDVAQSVSGALVGRHERQRPRALVVRTPAGQPRTGGVPVLAERRILQHTASVGVGEAHTARPSGEQQPGDADAALGVDLHRVDAVVLEPAEQHVDRLQPAQRPQPHPTLAHDEIGALGEVQPEPGGEVRLLDVRRMVDAARQHDDARVPGGGDVGEAVAQTIGERIERPQRTTRPEAARSRHDAPDPTPNGRASA